MCLLFSINLLLDSLSNTQPLSNSFLVLLCLRVGDPGYPGPVLLGRGEGHFPPAPPGFVGTGMGKSGLSRLHPSGTIGTHELDYTGPSPHRSQGHGGHLSGMGRFGLWEHHPPTWLGDHVMWPYHWAGAKTISYSGHTGDLTFSGTAWQPLSLCFGGVQAGTLCNNLVDPAQTSGGIKELCWQPVLSLVLKNIVGLKYKV